MVINQDVLSGTVLGEEFVLTLADVARACTVHADYVVELVDEGIVEPAGQNPTHWRFSAICLVRVRKAVHLQQDLGVNMAGVALALQLIDELDCLHRRLRMGTGFNFPE